MTSMTQFGTRKFTSKVLYTYQLCFTIPQGMSLFMILTFLPTCPFGLVA
jgi:hypothetical protein